MRREGSAISGPGLDEGPVALLVAREGVLPTGASEAAFEAGGRVLVVGSGARDACERLAARGARWWAETGASFRPGALAEGLAPHLDAVPLVVLPHSPDGRDLAPRLAARLGRPLLAGAAGVRLVEGTFGLVVEADLARLDGRLELTMEADLPAVATIVPGLGGARSELGGAEPIELVVELEEGGAIADASLIELREADVSTMDLAEAPRVVGGGFGLAIGASDELALSTYGLLADVAEALGASMGATRVVTDAGWVDHARQIGTTGVSIDPELYVAFGVSGASQHVGGLGTPRTVVSVNLDPSCPMTKLADLGIVADARGLLVALADRLAIPVAEVLRG